MTASGAAAGTRSQQGRALRGVTRADPDGAEEAVWLPRKKASEEDEHCGE